MNGIVTYTSSIKGSIRIDNKKLVEKYAYNYLEKNKTELTEFKITKACGIDTRYYVKKERLRDLASKSIINLLESSKTNLSEIDGIIIATCTPESLTPSNASLILRELTNHYQIDNLPISTFDINAACSGFLFGLELANNYIRLGKFKKIIVCGVDTNSKLLNGMDYHTGFLFGDGAGAFLVESNNDHNLGIQYSDSKCITDNISDITYYSNLSDNFNRKLELDGISVYKHGTKLIIDYISDYFNNNNLTIDNFDFICCHQANARMLSEISRRLIIPETKMLTNIQSVGNTASASIPICIDEFNKKNTFRKGNRILLCSFGAGYTLSLIDILWSQ